jgi:hypothetical protein
VYKLTTRAITHFGVVQTFFRRKKEDAAKIRVRAEASSIIGRAAAHGSFNN